MDKLPLARNSEIVIQDLGNEILVYDLTIDKAFCLNETSSIVFRNCDGKTSFEKFSLEFKTLPNEIVYLTLDILKEHNLLANKEYKSPFEQVYRRQVIKQVGLMSLVALPIASTVIAPTSAMAGSKVVNCGGNIPPNVSTGWHCNFGPGFGDAEFCNEISCNAPHVSHLCQSCVAKARLVPDPGNPNMYYCFCT